MPLTEERKREYLNKLGAVRREALAAGATTLELFSRSVGPVQDELAKDGPEAAGGVCRALSIAWLKGKKAGRDYLATFLGPGGVVVESVLAAAIRDHKALDVNKLATRDRQRTFTLEELRRSGFTVAACDVKTT